MYMCKWGECLCVCECMCKCECMCVRNGVSKHVQECVCECRTLCVCRSMCEWSVYLLLVCVRVVHVNVSMCECV